MTKYMIKISITCNEDKKTRMVSATVESTQTLDTLFDRINKVNGLDQMIAATKAKRNDGRSEAMRARHASGAMKNARKPTKPVPAKPTPKPALVPAKPTKVLPKPVQAPVRIKHQPSYDRVVDMRRKRD